MHWTKMWTRVSEVSTLLYFKLLISDVVYRETESTILFHRILNFANINQEMKKMLRVSFPTTSDNSIPSLPLLRKQTVLDAPEYKQS